MGQAPRASPQAQAAGAFPATAQTAPDGSPARFPAVPMEASAPGSLEKDQRDEDSAGGPSSSPDRPACRTAQVTYTLESCSSERSAAPVSTERTVLFLVRGRLRSRGSLPLRFLPSCVCCSPRAHRLGRSFLPCLSVLGSGTRPAWPRANVRCAVPQRPARPAASVPRLQLQRRQHGEGRTGCKRAFADTPEPAAPCPAEGSP